jgi:hypothetical protein
MAWGHRKAGLAHWHFTGHDVEQFSVIWNPSIVRSTNQPIGGMIQMLFTLHQRHQICRAVGHIQKTIFDKNPTSIPAAQARSERINRIVDLLEDRNGHRPLAGVAKVNIGDGEETPMVVAAAVAVAYIAVVAVTYVVAASQVGVVLNVGVVATAWTQVAVWGAGGGGEGPYIPRDPGTDPRDLKTRSEQAVAENIRNMQRTAFAASFFGRKDLAVEAVKKVIDKELIAMLEAAEQLDLIKFPTGNKKLIVSELKKLCHDAIGIGA